MSINVNYNITIYSKMNIEEINAINEKYFGTIKPENVQNPIQ